ncbi:MAG: hypothetical protein J5I93_13465 [Pirellulaceae bacterium]|nr:hypothetical protein [Pirellulaceae bacterium]
MPSASLRLLSFGPWMLSCFVVAACSRQPPQVPALSPVGPLANATSLDQTGLELLADGRVTRRGADGGSLAADELRRELTRLAESGAGAEPSESGPELTVSAADDAAHGALADLLRTSVDCGLRRFFLRTNSAPAGFAFTLQPPPPAPEGLSPSSDQLPAMQLRLEADDAGALARISLNGQEFPDLAAVQTQVLAILGDQRGPGSIQDIAELEMACDAALRIEFVVQAMEAVTGHDDREGLRRTLIRNVRPVCWNDGLEEVGD